VTEIIVYGRPNCPMCNATQRALKMKALSYVYLNLEADPAKAEEFKAAGYLTAPVVEVRQDGEVVETWAGFRHDRIKHWSREADV